MKTMTQECWNSLTPAQKDASRDNSDLSPQLVGLERYRVEVVTLDGEKRRFIVGKSTGWKPCHLEIKTRRSMCGDMADKEYQSVTVLYKV